jgi:hypothetical protein
MADSDEIEAELIVPTEPTEAMILAGVAAAEAHPQITLLDKPTLYYAYKAMVAAAQP